MEDEPPNKNIKNLFWINLLVIAIGILAIAVEISRLPEKVPLYYSLPWGNGQLAEKNLLFLIPVASLAVLGLNSFLSRFFGRKQDFLLATASAAFSLFFSVLGLISLLKIIFLVS